MLLCPDLFTFETEVNFANWISPQSLHLLLGGAVAYSMSTEDKLSVNSCQGK